jgi:hypothetical protein
MVLIVCADGRRLLRSPRLSCRMLEEKGFGLQGDEPASVQVNRFLRLEQIQSYFDMTP